MQGVSVEDQSGETEVDGVTHSPECLTCTAYHGGAFVCAIHPTGPTRRPCPDYVQGPRYRRQLEVRHVEEPPKPPVAAEVARERYRINWRWQWRGW